MLDYIFRELAISYQNREDLAHTPSIGSSDKPLNIDEETSDDKNQFLRVLWETTCSQTLLNKCFFIDKFSKHL